MLYLRTHRLPLYRSFSPSPPPKYTFYLVKNIFTIRKGFVLICGELINNVLHRYAWRNMERAPFFE